MTIAVAWASRREFGSPYTVKTASTRNEQNAMQNDPTEPARPYLPKPQVDGEFTEDDYKVLSVCASCHRPVRAGERRNILHDAQRLYLFGWHLHCPVPPGARKYITLYGTPEMKAQFLLRKVKDGDPPQQAVQHTAPEKPDGGDTR